MTSYKWQILPLYNLLTRTFMPKMLHFTTFKQTCKHQKWILRKKLSTNNVMYMIVPLFIPASDFRTLSVGPAGLINFQNIAPFLMALIAKFLSHAP